MKRQREEDTDIEAKGGVEEVEAPLKVQRHDSERRRCPFLDTINRQLLDFDSEMVCFSSARHAEHVILALYYPLYCLS